jgi:hypothetical protein
MNFVKSEAFLPPQIVPSRGNKNKAGFNFSEITPGWFFRKDGTKQFLAELGGSVIKFLRWD